MPPKPASQPRGRGRGGACPVGGRRSRRDAPTPKRHRGASSASDDFESATEVDPAVVADSLLACLSKDDDLMVSFIDKLFKMPSLQDKIVAQVMKVLKTTSTENVVKETANAVSHDLTNTIEKLSNNVEKLTTELTKSRNQCDELEQYSRRNNIIISGIPENDTIPAEDLVLTLVNEYAETPIRYSDIDRTHRITRTNAAAGGKDKKPRDIIVKFCSYKSKKAILSREPMKKLKAANEVIPDNERIFIREDLTKARNSVLYKGRVLKRAGHIKDAFTRDGRIVLKLFTDKVVFITSEDEFVEFCKDRKIKYVDPKGTVKRKPASGPSHYMNIDKDSTPGGSHSGMDPAAAEFIPSQTPMDFGMGHMTQDPPSPSQSLLK